MFLQRVTRNVTRWECLLKKRAVRWKTASLNWIESRSQECSLSEYAGCLLPASLFPSLALSSLNPAANDPCGDGVGTFYYKIQGRRVTVSTNLLLDVFLIELVLQLCINFNFLISTVNILFITND